MVAGFNAYQHWSCEFESRSWRGVLNIALCYKVCQWLASGWWFSPGTPVSSINKTDHQDITDILLNPMNIITWGCIKCTSPQTGQSHTHTLSDDSHWLYMYHVSSAPCHRQVSHTHIHNLSDDSHWLYMYHVSSAPHHRQVSHTHTQPEWW